jgi:NCS1 family nucleobase:cation symporter-1
VAFLVPVGLTITAIIIGEGAFYDWFYSYGWFTGSTLGGLIYWLTSRGK